MKKNKKKKKSPTVGIVILTIVALLFMALLLLSPKNPVGVVSNNSQLNKTTSVTTSITSEQAHQAMLVLKEATLSHPEPLVREKLFGWISSHKVLFAANNILPEMSSSVENNKGKEQVLLWYNATFVLNMPDISPNDKQAYMWLVLYHEAVHIDDHFSGRMLLMPAVSDDTVSEETIARKLWDMEWSAVTKEWALAKKLQKPQLVPTIYAATKNGETPRTFLEGFYHLQVTGNAVALNSRLKAGFTARYREELAKLPAP